MNKVLDTTRYVVDGSKHVSINRNNAEKFCSELDLDRLRTAAEGTLFDLPEQKDDQRVDFVFVINSLNFCYWGEPKWAVEHDGQQIDGAMGMSAALKSAIGRGVPILDAGYLATMPREDLEKTLQGNTEIPLFEERLQILREIGSVLSQKYDGHFMNAVRAAGWDASRLLELITTDFPSYDDHATYAGRKVYFHKRAQLAIFDIHKLLKSKNPSRFTKIDQLTAFADYKVPQALRKFGIIEYSPQLAAKVDNRMLLTFGCEEETEIRANTIWAIELMKTELRKRAPETNSTDIDYCLWMAGQKKSPGDKPYHLCRNIAY